MVRENIREKVKKAKSVKEAEEIGRKFYKQRQLEKKKKQLGLFQKPSYKKYSKIISFKSPTKARESTKKLEEEFVNSKTNAKRLRIARVAQYSANRARATVKRKNLSRAEKSEYRKISTIYNNSANMFFKEYDYYIKNK